MTCLTRLFTAAAGTKKKNLTSLFIFLLTIWIGKKNKKSGKKLGIESEKKMRDMGGKKKSSTRINVRPCLTKNSGKM